MQISVSNRCKSPRRNLKSLQNDFKAFQTDGRAGRANIKNEKFYNNVIDEPLFNIQIDLVGNSRNYLTNIPNVTMVLTQERYFTQK